MIKYITIVFLLFSNVAFSQRAIFDDNYLNYTDVAQATDVDVQAFISAAGITDPTQIKALNRLVLDLKGVNNPNYYTVNMWASFIAIYPMIGGTATSMQWNLKDPRDLDAAYRITWVNNPTFSANGVDFNGASGSGTDYGNTHFVPYNFAPSILNNCSMAWYTRDKVLDANTSGRFAFASVSAGDTGTIGISVNRTGVVAASDMGSDNQVASYAPSSALGGLVIGSRVSSTDNRVFVNGLQKALVATAQTGKLPSDTLRLGTGVAVTAGVPGVRTLTGSSIQCAFASLSFGLTQMQQLALYNAVQQYQTTLNRQVN